MGNPNARDDLANMKLQMHSIAQPSIINCWRLTRCRIEFRVNERFSDCGNAYEYHAQMANESARLLSQTQMRIDMEKIIIIVD